MNEQFFISFNAHIQYLYEPNHITSKACGYVYKKLSGKKSAFLIWQTLLYEKNKFNLIKNRKAQDERVYSILCLGLEVMNSLIVRFGEPEFEEILENFKEQSNERPETPKDISKVY